MVWYSVCGVLRWGSAQVVSSTCAQVKSCGCGQGQRRRGTRERQVWGRRSRRRLKPFQPRVQLPNAGQSSRASPLKAEVPAHSQLMSRLLASDKDSAPCRVERRASDAGRGVGREAGGRVGRRRRKRRSRGWPNCRLGARARAERTLNMPLMSVTLDVSKLGGWLNATVFCRVERSVYDAGRGAGQGRHKGVGRRRRKRHARGGPRLKVRGRGTRGAHEEHVAHARDLGRVEVQRLVERPRVLPSRNEGIRCRARCGPGGGRAWGGGGASGMFGEGPTEGWGPGHARSAPQTCRACL